MSEGVKYDCFGTAKESVKIEIHEKDGAGNVLTLLEAITITWRDKQVVIPAGFESDGVSTPRFLWSTVSPAIDPTTIRAGIAHDYIYRTQPPNWTRKEADEMFYDLCREDGMRWIPAQKAYWGLRAFGGKAWKENAKLKEGTVK